MLRLLHLDVAGMAKVPTPSRSFRKDVPKKEASGVGTKRKSKATPKSKTVLAAATKAASTQDTDPLVPKATAAKSYAMSYAVARVLRLKFAHVSRTKLATVVDSEGNSLDDVIGAEIRRTNLSGEYIKASFWALLEPEFGLQCGEWEALGGACGRPRRVGAL